MRVVFLHPDLGIGGAERLVCDAALALKSKGHRVSFLTTYHNPEHCFPETRDGTFPVTVVANWFPRSILGRCRALCMYIRMIIATLYLIFFTSQNFDLVFVDQVAHSVPLLTWCSSRKNIFYCHYPDMLLSKPGGALKRLYRAPLDWLEEYATGQAHAVMVNSAFTKGVFESTFDSLSKTDLKILYPALDTGKFDVSVKQSDRIKLPADKLIVCSINRYERKKGIQKGLEAVKLLKGEFGDKIHFIHGGGYDLKNVENIEHKAELEACAQKLGLVEGANGDYQFMTDLTNDEKVCLLQRAAVTLYTPIGEHFGIVPLESMACSTAVVAMASGGPLETVENGATGLLVPAPFDAEQIADKLSAFMRDEKLSIRLGEGGKAHVDAKFSFDAFACQLERICLDVL